MTNQNFTYSSTGNLAKSVFFSGEAYEKRATAVFFGLDYFPYGKILRSFYPNGERYLTTGHERDHETEVVGYQGTGLDNRGARLYDSDVARFLSLDPAAMEYPSLSDYCYVAGNPVMFIDPDGKRFGVPGEGGDDLWNKMISLQVRANNKYNEVKKGASKAFDKVYEKVLNWEKSLFGIDDGEEYSKGDDGGDLGKEPAYENEKYIEESETSKYSPDEEEQTEKKILDIDTLYDGTMKDGKRIDTTKVRERTVFDNGEAEYREITP